MFTPYSLTVKFVPVVSVWVGLLNAKEISLAAGDGLTTKLLPYCLTIIKICFTAAGTHFFSG